MIKYYCDRCGVETDADFYRFNYIRFENILDKLGGSESIYVCPECYEEIKKFASLKENTDEK